MDLPLSEPPLSSQNPLLGLSYFHRFCQSRFRRIGFQEEFKKQLGRYRRRGALKPVFIHKRYPYFSTFQVWELLQLRTGYAGLTGDRFYPILSLLMTIQDYYLPEIRSDQRWGWWRDYHGMVALSGANFVKSQAVLLPDLRRWRAELISKGEFKPADTLRSSGLTKSDLVKWFSNFAGTAADIDPIWKWRPLVRYMTPDKREQLQWDALIARDLVEMAEILLLFANDSGNPIGVDVVEDLFDLAPRAPQSNVPEWKRRRYGDSLKRPYEMLEFLTNSFMINPRPRAIVLTEGGEHEALSRLFEFYGYVPDLLGIEFRSLFGVGNFGLARWKAFVEYMHEKQVLVYFVLDNEGRAAAEARKLLAAKRTFQVPGLRRVMPRGRIRIWRSSFEEANFTNLEISNALRMQNFPTTPADVRTARTSCRLSKKGLIEELRAQAGLPLSKVKLARDLMNGLLDLRRKRPAKTGRPAEQFVRRAGRLIAQNYLPTGVEHRRANFATRALG